MGNGKGLKKFNEHLPAKFVNFARFLLLVFVSHRYELVKSASPSKLVLWVGRPIHLTQKKDTNMKKNIESEATADLVKELQMACIKSNQVKSKLDFETLMKIAETAVIGHSEFRQAQSGKMSFADIMTLLKNDAFKELASTSMSGDL